MSDTETLKAVIICSPDVFANAIKPEKLKEYLEARSFEVQLLPIFAVSRLGETGFAQKLPGINARKLYTYMLEALRALARTTRNRTAVRCVNSLLMIHIQKNLGVLLYQKLKQIEPDIVICETNLGVGFVALPRVAKLQILDLPVPGAEEMYFGDELSKKAYQKLKKYEIVMYGTADAISFHWHTYAEFVRKSKYNGKNFIDLSYGTTAKKRHAIYAKNPKVIFLGLLNGYWVNIPLLEELCSKYPNIDVYGGPKPTKGSKINYKGYAPSLDIMAKYQFGLTTISDDLLRRQSFSSKHLEYISYGLPVFTPSWRRDSLLDKCSIYYDDVEDFIVQLKKFKGKQAWTELNKAALLTANKLSWSRAFKSFDKLLKAKGL